MELTTAKQVNEIYQTYENNFISTLDKHVPLKSRYMEN